MCIVYPYQICAYESLFTHLYTCMWRSEVDIRYPPCSETCFIETVSHWTQSLQFSEAGQPMSSRGLPFPVLHSSTGIKGTCLFGWLFKNIGDRDLNSGLHASIAGTLPRSHLSSQENSPTYVFNFFQSSTYHALCILSFCEIRRLDEVQCQTSLELFYDEGNAPMCIRVACGEI